MLFCILGKNELKTDFRRDEEKHNQEIASDKWFQQLGFRIKILLNQVDLNHKEKYEVTERNRMGSEWLILGDLMMSTGSRVLYLVPTESSYDWLNSQYWLR